MKTSKLAALVFTIALTSSSYAGPAVSSKEVVTPPPPPSDAGFFVGAEAGVFWLQDLSAGDDLSVDFKFKRGYGITIPVGYQFGNGFSVSLSGGYDHVDFDQVTGVFGGARQDASTRGSIKFVPLMANGAYTLKLVGNLSWYIGAGVGAVYEDASFDTYDFPAARSIKFGQLGNRTAAFNGISNTEWNFGFQAFTGLAYQVCPNASLKLGYRYMNVDSRVSVNGISSDRLQGQTAEFGVMIKF